LADVARIMASGRLITLEGGEGTGKSTQAARLAQGLAADGLEVVATREPGGSPGAEAIRDLLVRGAADRWSAASEALLLYVERGAIVVCDRFADSTRAYQGVAAEGPMDLIAALEALVLKGVQPDLTLILDLPAKTGLARAAGRKGIDTRFETKGVAFHQKLREAFLAIAKAEPERCVIIDAQPPIEDVAAAIWTVVTGRLRLSK
jgi:dTMP kinase